MKLFRLVVFFVLCSIFPGTAIAFDGKVVAVVDGDTLKVLKDGVDVAIKLAFIDCPELGQPYGEAAKQFTTDMVAGKTVKVWEIDKDQDGRSMAFVFTQNVDLNKELLKAGLAWHYKRNVRDPELAKLEFQARAAQKGLWRDPNPVPPWEWRK